MKFRNYDVAIVGGGAAGLSAALVLARSRRRVVVVDAGNPRNAPASHMHNFLSRDGMPPADMLAVGRAEVLGTTVRSSRRRSSNWTPPRQASTWSSTPGPRYAPVES